LRKRSLTIILATVTLAVSTCRVAVNAKSLVVFDSVEAPYSLPYRFDVVRKTSYRSASGIPIAARWHQSTCPTESRLLCYSIQNSWQVHDTLTTLVFYSDRVYANALQHFNIKTYEVYSDYPRDIDKDGRCDAALVYKANDSLFLEVFNQPKGSISRLLLVPGVDLDGNGYWDGRGFIYGACDANDDGFSDLLVGTDGGYDLYPRQLMCVDIHNENILWVFAYSGIVADRNFHVEPLRQGAGTYIVFGVASKGNAAQVGDMNDQHSYLIVLDVAGGLVFKEETGPVLSNATPVLVDYDSDGELDIIVPCRSCSTDAGTGGSSDVQSVIKVFSRTGVLLDSFQSGEGANILRLDLFDIDSKSPDEIVATLSDDRVIVYNQDLSIRTVCESYTPIDIWACRDFLGTGENQLLAATGDDILWLLRHDFAPLAQLALGANPCRRLSQFDATLPGPGGYDLLLVIDNGLALYSLSISKNDRSTVFSRKPWLTFFFTAGPLGFAIVLLGYYLRRARHRAQVMERQREELSRTVEDFRTTKDKPVDVEEHRDMLTKVTDTEQLQRALIDAVTESFLLVDTNLTILTANKTAAERLGTRVENLRGRHITAIVPSYMKKNELDQRLQKIEQVIKSGEPITTHDEHRGYIFDTHYYPIKDADGEVCCIAIFARDVTQRVQAQQALRESEERFKKLSDLTFEGILIHDMGLVIDVNESLMKLLGYTREELIGVNIIELCVPQEYHATIRENIVKRYARPYEVMVRKKDGTLFPIEIEARNVNVEDDEFRVAAIRDITERRQSQQALRESDSRYRLLIEASGSGINLLDREGNFLIVNERAAEIWGKRPEDLINRNVKEVFPPEFADEALSIIRKVSETGTGFEQERFIESIGKHFIENIQPVFDDKNKFLGVQVVTFDITRRKQVEEALRASENRYSNLIESAPEGIIVARVDRPEFLFVNPAICSMTGYSAQELLQMNPRSLAPEGSGERAMSEFRSHVVGEKHYSRDLLVRRKDGTEFYVSISSAVTEFDGKPAVMAFFRDITELTQKDAELQRRKINLGILASRLIELQENDRKHIARELHDTIAQDLSTTKVGLEKAILEDGGCDVTCLKGLSANLSATIRDLRNIASDLRPPMLDEMGLAASIRSLLERHVKDLKCSFRILGRELPLKKPREINVFRVFQEILLNVQKHAHADRIDVKLSYSADDLCIYVADNGSGFDIQQVKESVMAGDSFGLLNIEERIALAGGHLDIKTSKDSGTVYTITIPID